MTDSLDLVFADDHPTAPGHFPGNPLIPGALLLDEIGWALGIASAQVSAAKFLQPVRPGDTVRLNWEKRADGSTRFIGSIAGQPVLNGTMR